MLGQGVSSVSASLKRDYSDRKEVKSLLNHLQAYLIAPSATLNVGRYNYNVVANIGFTPTGAVQALIALDTGAGPNLIHEDAFAWLRIAPSGEPK